MFESDASISIEICSKLIIGLPLMKSLIDPPPENGIIQLSAKIYQSNSKLCGILWKIVYLSNIFKIIGNIELPVRNRSNDVFVKSQYS